MYLTGVVYTTGRRDITGVVYFTGVFAQDSVMPPASGMGRSGKFLLVDLERRALSNEDFAQAMPLDLRYQAEGIWTCCFWRL